MIRKAAAGIAPLLLLMSMLNPCAAASRHGRGYFGHPPRTILQPVLGDADSGPSTDRTDGQPDRSAIGGHQR